MFYWIYLTSLEKGIKCEACIFCNESKNSIIIRELFFLSYDIKVILNSFFGVKTLVFYHMRYVKSVIS